MEPQDERTAQPLADWFNPLSGWEAATRWNRATFDWMAKGWQQWVALMTTVPPHFIAPPTLESQRIPFAPTLPALQARRTAPLRTADVARAVAKGETQRTATQKKSAAKGRKRS